MRKHTLLLGILLGLLVPYVGILVGLQVSTTLGTVLAFPLIALSFVTGRPFGLWHPVMFLVAAALSIAMWTAIVAAADWTVRRLRAPRA